MGCREWWAQLTDWALDELSPAKVRELEQHIGQCEECARAAQRLRSVRQALASSLVDREMPGHLVLVGEKPGSRFAGFWAALLRTAALSAAAAAIFLSVTTLGLRYGGARLHSAGAWAGPTMTQAELQALVAKVVAAQVSLQKKEIQAAAQAQEAGLRQEEMANLASFAQQLQYLERTLKTEWKETQEQNEVIRLVAQGQQSPTH